MEKFEKLTEQEIGESSDWCVREHHPQKPPVYLQSHIRAAYAEIDRLNDETLAQNAEIGRLEDALSVAEGIRENAEKNQEYAEFELARITKDRDTLKRELEERKAHTDCQRDECPHWTKLDKKHHELIVSLGACKERLSISELNQSEARAEAARLREALEERSKAIPVFGAALVCVEYEDKMAGQAGHFLLSSDTSGKVKKALEILAALTPSQHPAQQESKP